MGYGVDAAQLIIPTFVAGLLTFLAPCTLPLLPAYLGFIGGVSLQELKEASTHSLVRRKVMFNALLYVLGFSLVFILLGVLVGIGGVYLIGYRAWLTRVGGVVVLLFGLWMMGVLKLPWFKFLQTEHRFNIWHKLKPGEPWSAFIFGATFAFGWTPCVGPILGSVLLLASSAATVGSGALLLAIFSLGLAVPFLLVAWGFAGASRYLVMVNRYFRVISLLGGVLLIFLGYSLLTDSFNIWISYFYKLFGFINYDKLYNYF